MDEHRAIRAVYIDHPESEVDGDRTRKQPLPIEYWAICDLRTECNEQNAHSSVYLDCLHFLIYYFSIRCLI